MRHKVLQIVGIVLGVVFTVYLLLFLVFYVASSPMFNGAKPVNKKLSKQYYYKNDSIVFVSDGNFFSLGGSPIEGADKGTFEVLAYNLARDKYRVYYNERILENADPQSFEFAHSGELLDDKYPYYIYTKDAERVYYLFLQIQGADAATHQHLWGNFSRDSSTIFYEEHKLTSVIENPKKVEQDVENRYLVTGEHCYFKNKLVVGVDVESFIVLDGSFAKDKSAVYFEDRHLNGVDPISFEVINESYQRDNNQLYFNTQPLPNSDPGSYSYINQLFSKDDNNVYFVGRILMDMNPNQFDKAKAEELNDNRALINLVYDDQHTFFAQRNKWTEISGNHHVYNNEVYCFTLRVIGADPKSFNTLPHSDDMYAKDATHVFYHSQTISNADIDSFEAINYQFAKDKNHVYFFEKRLVDIDPDSFVYQEGMYGEDVDEERARLVLPDNE